MKLDTRMDKKYIIEKFKHVLNDNQLNVFTLHYFDNLGTTEIGRLKNITGQRARQILNNATYKMNVEINRTFFVKEIREDMRYKNISMQENLAIRKILVDILN
jgi:predicted DNA-binding protein YlxM (UPF0122 family)